MSLIQADARQIPLADGSVHCVVTSPPYWGLRDYGTAQWVGGDAECKHGGRLMGNENKGNVREVLDCDRSRCYSCGAIRIDNQLGLERTPEEYVGNMVAVFREVRRALRDDGVLWLNLGDCFATGAGSYRNPGSDVRPVEHGGKQSYTRDYARAQPKRMPLPGLKPKDLVGIPWRVAFALQADGWYLRSDVIWSKPNPMPESVRDRPTKAHEYVFLLTKSGRYWWDAEAVREDGSGRTPGNRNYKYDGIEGHETKQGILAQADVPQTHRNIRTVWTISTQPYVGAHYAVMPERLVERCILAGCPTDGTVLDPFVGSGTVVKVARNLGRHGVGLDLSREYLTEQAAKRIRTQQGLPL